MNFRADRAGGVAETVARGDVVFEWVLLGDLLPGVDPRGRAVSRGILLIATADIAAPAPWDPELLRTVSILSWGRHDEGSSPGDSAGPRDEAGRVEREIVRAPRSALGGP